MNKTNILTMSESEFDKWCSTIGMAPLPSIHTVENLLTLYCRALRSNAPNERVQCLTELAMSWQALANDTAGVPALDSVLPRLPWCTQQEWRH